ncbi:MCP methyltransferase, CheR-type [Anaeromyxobacter dehalogenans 2CP-1]|uniref:MCP methyltransferase, CheR-type n=1 Tax=Anaeromyxobacter dehalogenans (strain ATCC BAA-258 / DSM 21875 / 2CP-1) TaxID=455488 RepID=B8J9M7_ANAD2|nr:CheR family methyltransferase [Anaeromyxobacter dehalogenans]ACL67415.1 MCP methyltransferase, CheR-type [Anaeromyxobacter dehalogenans 2CP-1]
MTDGAPGPAALAAVARALAAETGLSLASGLGDALRAALDRAADDRGTTPARLATAVAGGDAAALAALVEQAAVRETSFWRHPEQLAALARLAGGRPAPLRLWSAGCASGEEAYGLAMLLREAGRDAAAGDRILATDLSARALEAARRARYGPRALRRVPPAIAARWLLPAGSDGARVVHPDVRAPVELRHHNLVRDPLPGPPFDAVLCRNVLIYFDPAVAATVLRALLAAVRPGGWLVLGPVELPLAAELPVEWVEDGGATLLRRPR